MSKIKVAATQMACGWNIDENIATAEKLVQDSANRGANIILLQELFETPYFCQKKNPEHFKLATFIKDNKALNHFQKIAKALSVVLPISFFEADGNSFYNSLGVIDADGKLLGVYRKTHIPTGPGYEETFYFKPGDTGFKVWHTKYAKIGVGICWDQWFSEAARCMTLLGAEILFYPTAIGSEPMEPDIDSRDHWQLCMQGHSAANIIPVVASNRIGVEKVDGSEITFYGSSFITNHLGKKIVEADRNSETVLVTELDLDASNRYRESWGLFSSRQPASYQKLSEPL
jgi:N-carbamoylputrescine amidase